MLTTQATVSNGQETLPEEIVLERRRWVRRPAVRTRARLAWRTGGLRESRAPAHLINICEGGVQVATSLPIPDGLPFFWVGLESLRGEWVKATIREAVQYDLGWIYHVAFLESCAPGILERACTRPV
jgi:hypothetical protein